MSKPKTLFVILTVIIALVLTVGTVGATSPDFGVLADPQSPAAPQGVLSTVFTYQGHLTQNGNPVSGTCDFRFNLWNADSGGTRVGTADVPANNVQVTEGEFAVQIDFGIGAFDGSDRYLQIEVRCPAGSGTFNGLGRQPLAPTPMAMSLVPDALIEGSSTTGNLVAVKSDNGVALRGESQAVNSSGLIGVASATSGFGSGVYGTTASTDSGTAGVYGNAGGANLVSNHEAGVYGESNSGYGVFGVSVNETAIFGISEFGDAGVYGQANAASGLHYGVYGSVISTDAGSAGVYGHAGGTNLTSDREVGVFGESHDGYGVFGVAIYQAGVYGVNEFSGAGVKGMSAATSGETYGVQGISYSSAGHGGHFVNSDYAGTDAQVGVWAGSYSNNPIEAHAVNASGVSINRVFYVDVTGEVYADGSFHNTGADFAEMLPAVEGLDPADVLVIGLDGKLAKSTEAYQPTVVGVYSTEPGFVGGAEEDGNPADEIPLAIVGVVPVKVSAENGAIQPGDMLVASATPGHAMKADPDAPNGTVIGKALEPLDDGTGVILMLVMLQ